MFKFVISITVHKTSFIQNQIHLVGQIAVWFWPVGHKFASLLKIFNKKLDLIGSINVKSKKLKEQKVLTFKCFSRQSNLVQH